MRHQKKGSRAGLKRKLDKVAKEVMYRRDGHQCVMCGSTSQIGWGHVFSSNTESTRWDLMNIHAQCWPHNFAHVRDQYPYFKWFEDKYGKKELEALRFRFKNPKRNTMQDLRDKLAELEKLLTASIK